MEKKIKKMKTSEIFEKIYPKLNPAQREAVLAVTGPLLVLAGAGSGKTTVLVNRIAQIIKYGQLGEQNVDIPVAEGASPAELEQALTAHAVNPCPPWAVLAITFTNKAAGEIKRRLQTALGSEQAGELWAGTFHSVCAKLLRITLARGTTARLGIDRDFTIYDTDDSKRLITKCVKDLNLDEKVFAPRMVMSHISSAKDKMQTPEKYLDSVAGDFRQQKIAEIYARYASELERANAVDFDDIILKTVQLLSEDGEVREHYQRRFRYILVDEYQDTSHAQNLLVQILGGGHRNVMAVGDDDQSIYRFRGAVVDNILNFGDSFPGVKVIKLEQNYRSTQNILDAANCVISKNTKRHGKNLWCDAGKGELITLRQLENQNIEGDYIVSEIKGAMSGNPDAKYSDFAVLVRINALGHSLERTFNKSGIPYRILGGTRFADRKEIRDITAYLALLVNPKDDLRLKRIINVPTRKIGETTVGAVEEIASHLGMSMLEVCGRAKEFAALARVAAKLEEFAALIYNMKEAVENLTLDKLIEYVHVSSGYRSMLEAGGESEEERLNNIDELIGNAKEFAELREEATLREFLEENALVSDVDNYDTNADAVVVMTIHAAKGLEFDSVFLPGMEENVFPGVQSQHDDDELEEERRLAYVAFTRARKRLYITHARERMTYGKTGHNPLSRFVGEIPSEYIHDATEFVRAPVNALAQGRASAAARPVRKTSAPTETFAPGEGVSHNIFGVGVILTATKMGSDTLYEIAFDKVGTKKLMATFAKLKKAE